MMKFLFLVALLAVFGSTTSSASDAELGSFEPKPIGRCPPTVIPNKPPRYLPDANDCSVYYECSGGTMKMLKCPPGQCFTRAKKGCA